MEHIITECHASGQSIIWGLVHELLTKKGIPQHGVPTFGQVLRCGLTDFRDASCKKQVGCNRLYTIAVSESTYLIWRIRCEWRIEREENQEKLHTKDEIVGRWLAMINMRLKLDCLMTDKRHYDHKAIDPKLVQRTWDGVLHDEQGLPDNWVAESGVLVATRAEHPPGHN